MQEILARSSCWWKTLRVLGVLLDSCLRDCARNPRSAYVTCRKPLRVWLFYWIPASAGMTNIGLLHSLLRRNDGEGRRNDGEGRRNDREEREGIRGARECDSCWLFAQPQGWIPAPAYTGTGFAGMMFLCRGAESYRPIR